MSGSEHEFGAVQLAAATNGAGEPVQVPQGQRVVLIPAQPGQTITLPTDTTDGLLAKIGPEGNLSIVIDGRTIIFQGYVQANEQSPIKIVTADGDPVDVADVVGATDPNLDIQTAAGPATGNTGDAGGGGIFIPFQAGPGPGLIGAEGVLGATALQYKLIDDERRLFTRDEDTSPDFKITYDILDGVVNEDDLPGDAQIIEIGERAGLNSISPAQFGFGWWLDNGMNGRGNDEFDPTDHEEGGADSDGDDGYPDPDREPLVTIATVDVDFHGDVPGKLTIDKTLLPAGLTSEGEPIIYQLIPAAGGFGNVIVAFVDGSGNPGKYDSAQDRLVFTIEVDKQFSDGQFKVAFTLYDNIDNTPPDENGDGKADLLGANEQILSLPTHFIITDSDGSAVPGTINLGVEDDIPFFGQVIDCEVLQIIHTDVGIVHDETPGVQPGSDDASLFNPNVFWVALDLGTQLENAGFEFPHDAGGLKFPGAAQTQVHVSFGADGPSSEYYEHAATDASARNSIFGELEDRTNADGDGVNDGENEHPFELFLIKAGSGGVPAEDNLATAPDEGNLTIADQLTNATVTWDGDAENPLPVYVRQLDAHTIVGYVNAPELQESFQAAVLDEEGPQLPTGEVAVFVIHIEDDGTLTFLQMHQLNHDVDGPTFPDHDDPFSITDSNGDPIIFVRATDYDGDHAVQPVNLTIEDDGPKFCGVDWGHDYDSKNGVGLIDEDKLSPNGNNDMAPGDDKGGTHTDGKIEFNFGVDQPGHLDVQGLKVTDSAHQTVLDVSFVYDKDTNTYDVQGANDLRTADGHLIELHVELNEITGQLTLTGVDSEDASEAFVYTLQTTGYNAGEFTFCLNEPLQHPYHDPDSQNDGPQKSYEDNLNFDLTVRGYDIDGDWADGCITIKVDDDSPKSVCDYDCVVEGTHGDPQTETQVLNFATGNIVTGSHDTIFGDDANNLDGNQDHPGADQPYTISKLSHDGNEYNLIDNGDGTFSVTKNGGNPLDGDESFDGKVLHIPTHEGGTLDIVLVSPTQSEVGDYKYTVPEFAEHDHDKFGGPATLAESAGDGFDEVSEWTQSFANAGIHLEMNTGALGLRTLDVSGPEYRGIGINVGGGDNSEVDNNGPDEVLTIRFDTPTDNAKVLLGALYDGGPDAGYQEIVLWQVFDAGNTLIASGQVLGSQTGLVPLDIDTNGVDFDHIVLTPLNNGAGSNSANNSDFVLVNVETCCPQDKFAEQFDYTLRDADGDESCATLTVDVKDTQPTIPTETSGGLQIVVDEDGLNPAGTLKDGIGDHQPGDLEEDHSGPNAAQDDAKFIGNIPFTPGADPVTIELSVGNGGDTGLNTVNGQNIFAAWDAEEHRLVGYIEGTDPSDAANQVFVMQITDEQSGGFTFTLLQPIQHPDVDGQENGDNENIPDPYVVIDVQIEDKDCDVAYTQVKVTIDDDMPIVDISATSAGTTQHDETAGRQTDSGDDDQNGSVPSLFNVLGAGPAIGWAHDGDSVVQINTARYGADGPGNAAYSLVVGAGGVDSGVDTTDGHSVWLYQGPNGIIVGREGSGADGSTPNPAGAIIFAISIDSDGELTVVQYDSLKHPDNPNNFDEDIGLNTEALQVKLTLTDADGDSASDTANIGNLVRFDDDGPKAKISATGNSVQHDETAGVQNPGSGADRDQAGPLPAAFSGIVGTLIGWAHSDSSVVTTTGSSTGNDDEGATTSLKLAVAFSGVDSGIDDTATGQNILLYQNGDVVEGRVGGSGGAVAFAVIINSNGTIDVAQYRALEHPNPNDNDEDVSISNSALKAVYTITDGDGDQDSASVDIGSAVHFDDDGPNASITQVSGAQIILDESVGVASGPYADPNANDEDGNVGGDIGYAKVAGNLLFVDNSSFGTDGPGTKAYTLSISSTGTDSGLDDVATGQNIRLYQVDADTIEGRVNSSGGAVAFRIDINQATGEVTISQFRALEHDNPGDSAATHDESGSPEIMDANKLFIVQTVTDGDNDKDTDSIDLGKLIKFEDDGPVAVDDVDSVTEDGDLIAIGNVYTGANATAFGSDANATDGNADDVGSDGLQSLKWVDPDAPSGFDGNGQVIGDHGTLFVNSNGDYKYVLNNDDPDVAALNTGDKLYETFSYVITDKDGDTSTAELKITINGHSDTNKPNFEDENTLVDEDGLPTGIFDDPVAPTNDPAPGDDVGGHQEAGLPAPATEAISRDSLNINWDSDVGTIKFTVTDGNLADIHPLSGAVLTTANVSGNGTDDLTVWDGVPGQSNKIIEVKVIDAATSVYEVQLYQPIQHTDPNSEDNKSLPVTVTATNGGGASEHTLTVSIDDDRPVTGEDNLNVAPATAGTADIVFIVDVSGSMTNGGGSIVIPTDVPGFDDNRLGLARYSMQQLLLNHPEILNVQFVKFDDGVSSTVWMTRADALTYIGSGPGDGNFVGGGSTNYDIALLEAMNVYGASTRPSGEADQTLVYFLSDGAPNTANDPGGDAGITGNGTGNDVSIAEWESFVTTPANNITNVFAIGLGTANVDNLEPVSYPNTDNNPNDGQEDNVVIIPDANITQLTQTLDDLLGSVVTPVNGNLLVNDDGGADGFGAPPMVSVTFNGNTNTFDASHHSFDIDLGAGKGSLHVNEDGTYVYTPPAGTVDGTPFDITYVIKDGDGDNATGTLHVDLKAPPETDAASGLGVEDGGAIQVALSGSDSDGSVVGFKIASLPANGLLYADAGLLTLIAAGDTVPGPNVYFVPNPNFSGAPTFLYAAIDNDGVQDPTPATATITVTPVNDAPDAAISAPSYNATELSNLNLHGTGLSISDIDAGGGSVTVTLSVGFGVLNLVAGNSGATIGVGNGTSSVQVTGTVTQINNLLGGIDTGVGSAGTIVYNTNSNAAPTSTTLTLTVHDNGNTGAGGDKSDSANVTINIADALIAPVAVDDHIYTNISDLITVKDSWLLKNDTDADTPHASLVIASATAGGNSGFFDTQPNHSGTNVTFEIDITGSSSLGNGDSTSFDYVVKDPVLADTGTVAVTYDTSGPVNGSSGADILIGLDVGLNGGAGDDQIAGTGTKDLLDFSNVSSNWSLTLGAGGSGTATIDGTDTYEGIDGITGGSGNNTLIGNTSSNILNGGDGNDTLDGGNDAVADTLNGGAGNDTLIFRSGADTHDGGDHNGGNDLSSTSGDVLDISNVASLDLTGISNAQFSNLETIRMNGGGSQTLTLNASDVISFGTGEFNPTDGNVLPTVDAIKVDGDAGDNLHLSAGSGQWFNVNASISNEPAGYTVWAFDSNGAGGLQSGSVTAFVIVDNDVTVSIV